MNFTHDPTEAFEGVLWATRGRWLTLRDVEALKAHRERTKIPGEIVVDRARISFLQVLP